MTWITAQAPFRLPQGMSPQKKTDFCLEIINKYRRELPHLRVDTTKLRDQKEKLEREVEFWKKRYKEKEKEINRLKKEIEKLTKTTNRYQVALFDHGNFKHPKENKKTKGGQKNHADTNREGRWDWRTFEKKRIFAVTCGKCHSPLPRVTATKQKALLDIIINPQAIKLILEAERQWCGKCKQEVNAKDARCLPFTEYGINTFMMVLILRFKTHSSLANISRVIAISHGLTLAKSDISNLLKQAASYLGERYEELKAAVRKGNVMYSDETGWLVAGQKAWMWIMANDKATVYTAAESRGKGIAEQMYGNSNAYAMTDGLASYTNTIPTDKHLYCWSHMLRFSFEETVNSPKHSLAVPLREELVRIYRIKQNHPEYSKGELERTITREIDILLKLSSNEESFVNIKRRLATQKEGLIKALLVTESGTNNLAERELRNMAIKRNVSYGSDTYQGMETTAVIASIIQTLSRNKESPFLPTLKRYIQKGVQEKYQQYLHIACYDP